MPDRDVAESPPLRVGLLADQVGRPGGIGRYTTELLGAYGRREDLSLVVAAPASSAELVRDLVGSNLHALLAVPDHHQVATALWERYASGRQLQRAGVQIVHGTKHLLPRVQLPTVLSVHDIMTITRASESKLAKRLLLPRQYRASLDQAGRLVAASAATRDRLRAVKPAWADKALVVPNGMSRHLLDARAESVPELLGVRFALVVGDLTPRKNVRMLLDIWDRVARDTAVAGEPGLHLVVLGSPGPQSDATTRQLADLETRGMARWLRGASDGCLRWCYEHTTVVLFPTVEEGFGFPVLEARTFHAPVVTSTDPALVEVSKGLEGVTHLNATHSGEWITAIVRAGALRRAPHQEPALPAGAVTWDQNAAEVVALYRELLNS